MQRWMPLGGEGYCASSWHPARVRAELIGKLFAGSEEGGELLVELEEKEWARQWLVERLQAEA